MSVLLVLTELRLKQTSHFDAEVTKHLKQIKTKLPSLVALCSKFPLLLIEMVGLFGLRRPDNSR